MSLRHEPGNDGPGSEAFILTEANKPLVREWLKAQGLEPSRVDGMRDDTLYKAYRHPAFLKQLKTRADYYPQCAKENSHHDDLRRADTEARPDADQCGDQGGDQSDRRGSADRFGNEGQAAPSTAPLTEARVIELIKEYAPRSIINLLQLGEF